MQISLFSDNVNCRAVTVGGMESLSKLMLRGYGWSPGVFSTNYRNLDNFLQMDVIALDFDKGLSLEAAALEVSSYAHIIGTSRSHQKEKQGKKGQIEPPCDRFRVVFKLDRPIKSDAEYKCTFEALRAKFPQADPACSDASRFFFPCTEIKYGRDDGEPVRVITPPPRAEKSDKKETTQDKKGTLARSTLEFVALGALPVGCEGRHKALFKAARDYQEQGYDEAEAIEALTKSPICDELGTKEFEKQISKVYKREPKYEPRSLGSESSPQQGTISDISNEKTNGIDAPVPNTGSLRSLDLLEEALAHLANPEAVKGISTGYKEVDELLGGLRQSELGIIQAYPKSGKTVFLTNLMANLTAQGHKVGFASLEMHPAKQVEPDLYSILLKKDIRKGVTDEDRSEIVRMLNEGRGLVYFKRDRRPTAEEICAWARNCYHEHGVRFIFADHFHKFVPDESSVSSIARTITALTGLKYECPEMFVGIVVQPTKEQRTRDGLAERVGRNTLRGGASIFDECDWLINMHTKYSAQRVRETPWGDRQENTICSYPNDIREIEFEAIRAKPFSENMGKKLYMKYDKGTTEMKPHRWIAPEPERIEMPAQDEERSFRRQAGGSRPQSGWAENTWRNKRV